MKPTYGIKPLKWWKEIKNGTTRHIANTLVGECEIVPWPPGSFEWRGYVNDCSAYQGPSVEAAKRACERAYRRELKRALLPAKERKETEK